MRSVLLAGVLLLNGHGAPGEDLPVFTSSIEVVRLDVSVTRQGRPLRGLAAQDFEVRDNGAPQAVEVVGHEEKPVHAVLALDNSNSLAGERLARLKGAAHALLDVLRPDDTVSVLTFSDHLVLKARGGESRRDAHAAIESTRARLSTSLYDAAFAALTVADPAHGRPVVLIFSDGQDVGSWLRPEQVLRAARAADLVTHAVISQREGSDAHFLEELTAATGGQVWEVGDSGLEEAFVTALEEFRSRYTLQYAAGDDLPEPWHDVEVRVRRAGARVRVREGYLRDRSAP